MNLLAEFRPPQQPRVHPQSEPSVPADRHLVHTSGAPLHVWWARGRRRSRQGARWRCWFVYVEYRLADGRSAYRQLELASDALDRPQLWQELAQLELPGICPRASREQLIGARL